MLLALFFSFFSPSLITLSFLILYFKVVKTSIHYKMYSISNVIAYSAAIFSIYLIYSLGDKGGLFYDFRYGFVETFGFANPNSWAKLIFIFSLVLSLLLNNKKLFIFLSLLLLCSLNVIHARSFYIGIFFLFLIRILSEWRVNFLFKYTPLFLLSFLMVIVFFEPPFKQFLDILLSGRVLISQYAIGEFSVNLLLLGNNAFDVDNFSYALDNSYAAIIASYGIFFSLGLMWLYYSAIKKCEDTGNYRLLAMLTVFSIYSFVENSFVSFVFNPTFYYIVSGFYLRDSYKLETELK
ncbi:hypothetical protein [Pectobacterium sp. CHL-2024]|uniref:hypothetical protein n=1 Tax=Pectobacterium sp. CHL-2024 TaxID=3377079 RepID=UPI0037FC7B1F